MAAPTFSSQLDLLERERELASIDDLIAATPSGPRLLAIEGPPGIGKTALMAQAKARGADAGWRVLSARGSELERSFSYGVVRQLFEAFLASPSPIVPIRSASAATSASRSSRSN